MASSILTNHLNRKSSATPRYLEISCLETPVDAHAPALRTETVDVSVLGPLLILLL